MIHNYIKDRDIVLFSFQPWDAEIGSNFKDMALELSKYNRVLFVNRALDRASIFKGKHTPQVQARLATLKNGVHELEQIQPNIWVHNPRTIVESINWVPFASLHDLLNKRNNKRLADQINKAIDSLGFKNVILINDNDFIRGRYLKQLVHCSEYIFYIRDYMLGVRYFQRHGPRLESGLMKEVDMVVANSTYLANYSRQFNPNSFDIGQGCDLKNYVVSNPPMPEDLKAIKKPVIGYMGYISAWRIDAEIIKYLAERLPDCSIVLVGPADGLFDNIDVKHLNNLHFLGGKPAHILSNYIYYFDICINPQLLNNITIGNYPRKVDEYLAMGKPVVATETEAMLLFKPYTYLCKTKEDWVDTIKMILSHPEKTMSAEVSNERISFAMSHTWSNSIGRLGDAYHSLKNK